MDPATLATAAGTALVALMATGTWKKIRKKAAPERCEVEEDLASEWRRRLLRLLQQDIDLVLELQ